MKIILWLLLGYIGYRIIKGFLATGKNIPVEPPEGTETFQDPVCGMYVSAEDATVGRLEGERIYFCSRDCLDKYQEKLQSNAH